MSARVSLKDLNLEGKKVLVRVDFNVPLNKEGEITDDTRIQSALPTIKYILDKGGSAILMSHLGRPKGQRDNHLSLQPVAKRLGELLEKEVKLAPACIGEAVKKLIDGLKENEVLLLENLRFYLAEEKPEQDPSFAKNLANLGDIYVNDAFGTAHRKHASTYEIAKFFPEKKAAGFLMENEIEFLGETILNPQRPFYAILGGAKVSSKIGVIKSLIKKAERIFIGGAMSYTFLKAQGVAIGDSLCQEDFIDEVKKILQEAKKEGCILELPIDHVVAKEVSENAETKIDREIEKGYKGVDIGPETIKKYKSLLQDAKTVFWNGPLGVFEIKAFSKGTFEIAKTLAKMDATVVVGGGESVSAIKKSGLESEFAHLSTGGGASLEYIEKGRLPGIEVLYRS
jgi:phosphoglycerate kinase